MKSFKELGFYARSSQSKYNLHAIIKTFFIIFIIWLFIYIIIQFIFDFQNIFNTRESYQYFLLIILSWPLLIFNFFTSFIINLYEFYEINQLTLTRNNNDLNYFFNIIYLNSISAINDYFMYYNVSSLIMPLFNDLLFIFKNYIEYPIFILFGILFFFSTAMSLIFLNFLGLYGVFILNLVILIMLWFSIIPYINYIFFENGYYFITLGKWMYLNSNYKIGFDFLIDNVSLSFSFLTLTIALFVYPYTFSYFRYEPLVDRLILFLNAFIISMVFLVSSGNLIMLFLGWEMIGLTSFFLINFWSTRVGTLKAAFKAYSFNKVSDLFLFFSIILIFNVTFNLDILTFLNQIHLYENYSVKCLNYDLNYIELISIFLLGSAFIKSAQFGAHIWLPDSMEAPVPASALIHSATLVSAGIYLLLRFTNLFELSYYSFSLIGIIGSLTAFYGGFVSMYQSDVKRILAYSTISHCGFLMVMYTTGILEYVVLYLYVHGFFKAAVFLCVGNVIRFSRNIQDFKRMGLFYKFLPFDCFASFICLINLSGLPLTFGFFIKHFLFVGLENNYFLYYPCLIFCVFGAVTGLFYSYRLFYYVFFDIKKGKKALYYQSSREILNSKFYINSSIASNFCIIGLILIAYIVCLKLITNYILIGSSVSDFYKMYYNVSSFFVAYTSNYFLLNSSIINWFVLFLIIAIIFTPWRHYYKNVHYNSIYNLFLFSFFFFIMYKLL